MTIFEIKRIADKNGISHITAMKARQIFITKELAKWDDYYHERSGYIPEMTIDDGFDEIIKIQQAIKYIDSPPPTDEVTQEMIDQAKSVPVDKVVEFIRGKALCFNHDDKTPSAYWAKKVNRLSCPVCGKMWDTIDIIEKRDGLDFISAVRKLHAGNY
jgi:hypothetical protein